MKNNIRTIVFCMLIGLIHQACVNKYISPVPSDQLPAVHNLGTSLSVSQNDSILVKDSSEVAFQFAVKVLTINDSRCPSDVVCIWQGEVLVNFRVNLNSFTLRIGQSKEFDVHGQHYKITLTDVTPYPSSKNHDEQKRAIFIINRD